MKRAILIVDHGSRMPDANALVDQVADGVRARVSGAEPATIVRIAHLELVEPDVATGLDSCAGEGADEIVLAPFFLAPGRHSRSDLPQLVDEARRRHPSVTIHLAAPLGPHAKLVDILLERVDSGRASE